MHHRFRLPRTCLYPFSHPTRAFMFDHAFVTEACAPPPFASVTAYDGVRRADSSIHSPPSHGPCSMSVTPPGSSFPWTQRPGAVLVNPKDGDWCLMNRQLTLVRTIRCLVTHNDWQPGVHAGSGHFLSTKNGLCGACASASAPISVSVPHVQVAGQRSPITCTSGPIEALRGDYDGDEINLQPSM